MFNQKSFKEIYNMRSFTKVLVLSLVLVLATQNATAKIVSENIELDSIYGGDRAFCAITKKDRRVFCAGFFGDGKWSQVTIAALPVEVKGLEGAIKLAVTDKRICGLFPNNAVNCWEGNGAYWAGDAEMCTPFAGTDVRTMIGFSQPLDEKDPYLKSNPKVCVPNLVSFTDEGKKDGIDRVMARVKPGPKETDPRVLEHSRPMKVSNITASNGFICLTQVDGDETTTSCVSPDRRLVMNDVKRGDGRLAVCSVTVARGEGGSKTAIHNDNVSCSAKLTCGINDGNIECSGDLAWVVLGDGRSDTPHQHIGLNGVNYGSARRTIGRVKGISDPQKIFVGGYHACALDGKGDLLCWGYNKNGQIPRVTATVEPVKDERGKKSQKDALKVEKAPEVFLTATLVWPSSQDPASKIKDVVAGELYTCLLFENGNTKCFGTFKRGNSVYNYELTPRLDLSSERVEKAIEKGAKK